MAVVGGGPAGVELAANAAQLLQRKAPSGWAVDLSSAATTLAGLSGARLGYVQRRLKRSGVGVHYDARVDAADLDADVILPATGIRPMAVLRAFGLPTAPDGALRVDRYLRVEGTSRIFAVGDNAWFAEQPLDRVGVYAVRMQPVLLHNLATTAGASDYSPEQATLMRFAATSAYLGGLNLGFGRAILYRGGWTIRGRLAFRLKDAIDRRFMRRLHRAV